MNEISCVPTLVDMLFLVQPPKRTLSYGDRFMLYQHSQEPHAGTLTLNVEQPTRRNIADCHGKHAVQGLLSLALWLSGCADRAHNDCHTLTFALVV